VLGENAGFVGFGTTAESGFVPLLQPDDGVPPDFRLVMRKMHKKDVTTKLKALQEFLDLANTASEEDMLAVLTFWPSVYTKLAMDTDRRVREQVHIALAEVVKAVGKNLAPHLKTMSGCWYIGQSDTHLPAAQAASLAWKAAFPPHRLAGAVDFCQDEIIKLIIENLTVATAMTLSDPKCTPAEEMEAKYVRVLSMSLVSYASLLDAVTIAKLRPEDHKQLLASPKFWKLGRHRADIVRKSFFTAIAQLFVSLGDVIEERASLAVSTVLGNLGDVEAGAEVWSCGLQLLNRLPTAWSLINAHKAVFPAVWRLLATGGDGFPQRVYPYLMPFLSKIPPPVMTDCTKFLNRWFSTMLEGLGLLNKKRNVADKDMALKSFFECTFYVCNQSQFERDVKTLIVSDFLMRGIQLCVGNESMFDTLATYLLFWDSLSSSKADVAQLNMYFWAELKFWILKDSHYNIHLLVALGRSLLKQKMSNTDVKFAGDDRKISLVAELVNIFKIVWRSEVVNLKNAEKSQASLTTMLEIVNHFADCHDIFAGEQETKVEFYLNHIVPLSTNLQLEETTSKFTWAWASSLPDKEGINVLELFVKSSRPKNISSMVEIAKSSKSASLFHTWISSNSIQQLVVDVAKKLILSLIDGQSQNQDNWNTIKIIIGSGVPLPEQTQKKLFLEFQNGLNCVKNNYEGGKPVSCARLVEFVCDLLCLLTITHDDVVAGDTGTELVKIIFTLQDRSFGEKTNTSIQTCWQTAVANQPKLATTLSAVIAHSIERPLSGEVLYRLVDKAESLAAITSVTSLDNFIANLVVMFPVVNMCFSERAWYTTIVDMKQFFPTVSPAFEASLIQQAEVEPIHLVYANTCLTFLAVLCRGFNLTPVASLDDEARTVLDEERISLPSELITHEKLFALVVNTPLAVVYMQHLVKDKNCSTEIADLECRLSGVAVRFFSHLSKKNLDVIEHAIFEKCTSQDTYYNQALSWLLAVTYRFSEWDFRLNRFLNIEDSVIEGNYNTLVSFMGLISRYNIGPGTISSSLCLAIGKFISIQGLKTDEGTCLLWFIVQCLDLMRPGIGRLHISGVSEFSSEIQTLLEVIPQWKAENEDELLYNTDVSCESWSRVVRVCTVCNLLNLLVGKYTDLIDSELWDLITCSLVSWIGSLEESKDNLTSRAECMLFGVTVFRLAATVGTMLGPRGHHPSLSTPPETQCVSIPPRLTKEWEEFFSQGIFTILVPLYIKICTGKERLFSSNLVSDVLGQAIVHCPITQLLECDLPPLYMVQDLDAPRMADNITFFLNHFGPLLLSSCRSSQVTAAHVLGALTIILPTELDVEDSEECEIPRRLSEVVEQGEVLLNTLLVDFTISDPVGEMPTGNVAFTQTFGYLLAWRIILRLLENSGDEIRPCIAQRLESRGHINHLLNHTFRLLPSSAGQVEAVFAVPHLPVAGESTDVEIQQLAASCWTQVCRYLPAYARQWWGKLDRESQNTVERITCAQVTPALWSEEIKIITSAEGSDNLTLKVRDSVREVVATYSIDEGSMELVVSLPNNYPLGGLTVDSGKKVGVETGQWRKWMLQLTTFLIHQNGSIHAGLNLWKKNVDKRFEGVEECYICFYILHGSNHQLPKLGCRTCKKKFHTACLYKWFSTSNNSSCPLCRNLF